MENDTPLKEMKPVLFPLLVALLHAADHVANDTPACTLTDENRKRLLDGSLRSADDLWAALEAREAGAQT